MAGHKPKPTAIKQITGNPGKRKLNGTEPMFSTANVKCPGHLNAAAKREWRRLAPAMEIKGLLTDVDVAAFAAYCLLYSRWAEAEKQIQKTGLVVKSASGEPIRNPYLIVAERSLAELRKYETDLGFNPSARSRIHVPESVSDADPFAAFMQSIGADEMTTNDTEDELQQPST
jgi:P27 family predicted phage terminase small subunit